MQEAGFAHPANRFDAPGDGDARFGGIQLFAGEWRVRGEQLTDLVRILKTLPIGAETESFDLAGALKALLNQIIFQ